MEIDRQTFQGVSPETRLNYFGDRCHSQTHQQKCRRGAGNQEMLSCFFDQSVFVTYIRYFLHILGAEYRKIAE